MKHIVLLSIAVLCVGCVRAPISKVPTAPTVGFGGADAGFGGTVQPANKLGARMMLSYPACTPVGGVQCTSPYGLYLPPHGYPNWDGPLNYNAQAINDAIAAAAAGNSKPCITIPNALQFNNSNAFGCTTPTYDPIANAFNGSNQFTKSTAFGFTPTLPGYPYFSQYIANEMFSNTYTQQLPGNQSFSSIGVIVDHLDGGVNQNQNGLNFKPGLTPLSIIALGQTPGSLNPLYLYHQQNSVGDNFGIFDYATCFGGTSANGDEGCENVDMWTFQGGIEYSGSIISGGSAGSTSVTVAPTQGEGTQGGGRWLLDLTTGTITTGTIASITKTTFTTYTGSGTSWPTSTVNTILGTAITGKPGSYTVTPGSMSGITTSTVLCVADGGNFETVIPTATTGSTFTAVFQKPQLSTAIVASGGLCGYSVFINSDTINGLHVSHPVIRSTSGTSMDVWTAAQGVYQNYGGSFSNANNAYTLTPGAEVLHVNNGTQSLTDTLGLYPNTVAWTNGDTVTESDYPYISQQDGNTVLYVSNPYIGGSKWGRVYNFDGLFGGTSGGGSTAGILLNNSTPTSAYSTMTNFYPPPMFQSFGLFDTAITFQYAPATAALKVGGCAPAGCGPMNVFLSSGTNGQDYLQYDQSLGNWKFSVGLEHGTVGIGADGTISTPSGVTAGGSLSVGGSASVGGNLSAQYGEIGTAQNLALYSNFPSGTTSPWVSEGSLALATVTPSNAADPSGSTTAETVTAPTLTGVQSSGQGQAFTGLTMGASYTWTVCFKGHAGGEFLELGQIGGSGQFDRTITLNTSMLCYSVTGTASATSLTFGWVFDGAGNSGATIDVAWAQLEPTNYHGQYVATTSAPASVSGMVAGQGYLANIANAPLLRADSQGKIIPATMPFLTGTTGSIGGGALLVNNCATGTATVTGISSAMAISVTPVADPNASTTQDYDWYGYMSGTNTVTVKVCALVAGTPGATTYNIRAVQ